MEMCSQCETRPAMYERNGYFLCLSCYSKHESLQQSRNQSLRQLNADLTENMAWTIGLTPNPPQRQNLQSIHAHINNPIFNSMNISNSQIGMLNTGSINNVRNIDISVSTLVQSGQKDIAEALAKLTEAVVANQEIHDAQRTELIDQLETISAQAALSPENRKTGIIKPILTGMINGMSAIGALSKAWSMFGHTVCSYFGYDVPLKPE